MGEPRGVFEAGRAILLGDHPAGVADLVEGGEDLGPIAVPFKKIDSKAGAGAFFVADFAAVFLDVNLDDAWAKRANPVLGPAGVDDVADVKMPADERAFKGVDVGDSLERAEKKSVPNILDRDDDAERFGERHGFGNLGDRAGVGVGVGRFFGDDGGDEQNGTGAIRLGVAQALFETFEADFARGATVADFVTPISRAWRGMEVFQCPPNGSGLIVLMILGMIEKLGTVEQGFLSAERAHLHIEAARLAYRDRDAFLADPAQVEVPVGRLTSDAYLAQLAKLIAAETAMPELPPAGTADWARHKDTVYLSVVDRDGNACSFINSLFEGFGSGILAEKSGVMLQNRGYGFRLQDGHPNCIAPDKRPMHTIIPGMVMKNGQAIMPYGVMGGHFQPMGQSWFLANHFEYGMDVQEALDAPRLFPLQGKVQVERGIPLSVVDRLNRMGHVCELIEKPHGGGQAILIDRERGCLVGGSDPRKDGCALGY